MRYVFDWDPVKAATNLSKHGVSFDEAIGVFLDPLQLSRLDEDHGAPEERWVTLGAIGSGKRLVVVHTYIDSVDDKVVIRIISARPATRREIRDYEQGARDEG